MEMPPLPRHTWWPRAHADGPVDPIGVPTSFCRRRWLRTKQTTHPSSSDVGEGAWQQSMCRHQRPQSSIGTLLRAGTPHASHAPRSSVIPHSKHTDLSHPDQKTGLFHADSSTKCFWITHPNSIVAEGESEREREKESWKPDTTT